MYRSSIDRNILPTTSYAVLGLLSRGEMSGYDIKKLANHTIKYFFWSPASSQIYAELKRLTSMNYAQEKRVHQEHRPDKRLYRITTSGQEALRAWIEDIDLTPDVLKSTLLLKLFFGHHSSPSVVVEHLTLRRKQALENLVRFEEIEGHLANEDRGFYHYITLKATIAHTHAELVWLEFAIEELNRSMLP